MMYLGRILLTAIALGTAMAWQDDSQCGDPQVPLTNIVGGTPAVPGEYPWMAAMIINEGYFGCGASVIAPDWIVTAAHCLPIKNLAIAYDFIVGQPYLNGSLNENSQYIKASKIYVHPNFTGNENIYEWSPGMDIALLKLTEPFEMNDYVRPVCVPQNDKENSFGAGIAATVTGWGSVAEGADLSEYLLQVEIPIVDQEECRQAYEPGTIQDDMICAGIPKDGKDSCSGDSGGPLVSKINDLWYLAGIVSFGEGCARGESPGVYTRVTEFEEWLTPVFDGGEIEVDNECDMNEFLCSDGWCTDEGFKCNGFFDGCYLGSDENYCELPTAFFDHSFLRRLTPESIVENITVTSERECAEKCLNDYDRCLAFDLWYVGFENYECMIAGDTFETVETEEFLVYLLHFEIEKFRYPSETQRIDYIPGRFATPKWLPMYEITTSGFVYIIDPIQNEFNPYPFTAIEIHFVINQNGGPTECGSSETLNAVAIRAGPDFSSPLVNNWCLNVVPEFVIVPSMVARVEFRSANPSDFGFIAEYYGVFACDAEFNTSPGQFNSPLYPENYPDDTTCRTMITADPDQAVILVIGDFEMESDGTEECTNDFDTLSIYDSDVEDETRLIGRFCGNNYESYVRSTGPNMLVVFKSDVSINRRGFTATFSFVASLPCDETRTVAPGMIESPNYPGIYPDDAICRQTLMAPVGNNIRLTINDFALEPSTDCVWDYVSIYDSNAVDDDNLIGTYCGTDLATGAFFESTGQNMLVYFFSDGSFGDRGFQAMYEFVPANETGCDRSLSEPATFASPNYPNYYPNNQLCQTKITAPADKIIFLAIDDFQLEDDYANCKEGYDTLSIYDAEFADKDRLLGTYCGTAIPTYFTSTGRDFYVVFKSDVSNSRKGFQATIEFRDEPIPPVSPPPPSGSDTCGRQRAPLDPETNVVGGKPAQEGEWPWQGALMLLDVDDLMCGVSLLNEEWVLTAAHCMDILNRPSEYSIVMGTSNLLNRDPVNTQVRQVADIFIHPDYVKFNNDYDIALLKLETPFTMTDYVHPICVPPTEWDFYVQGGVECTVTGWGATFNNGMPLTTLWEVDVPLYDQQDCMDAYAPEPVTDRMVCAGYPWGGRDACTTDDGGPLVTNVGGQWYLMGVVSWGEGCGQPMRPHVYSRVTMLEDWIAPIFDGNDPMRGPIGICDDDEFLCSDGWCIDYKYKCDDSSIDCYDRTDLLFCESSEIYFDPIYGSQLATGSIRREENVNTPDECAALCLAETSLVCLQYDTYGVAPVRCRLGEPPYNTVTASIDGIIHFEMQSYADSGSTLTSMNGRIASSKFNPSPFTPQADDYFWIVNPGNSSMTGLTATSYTFGKVHSGPSDNCNSDFSTGSYVTIRSGPDVDSMEAVKHCLNEIQDDYMVEIPSTMTRLEFYATDENQYGFTADYKVYWSCDAHYTAAPTVISSPNYPEPYPNGITCRTRITAPDDLQVLIYLRDINLEDSGEGCGRDWDVLTIYDSDMEDPAKEIGQYCDSDYDTPFSLRSTGQDMLLVFKTDSALALTGYEAAFYFVPKMNATAPPPTYPSDVCGIQTAILEPEMNIIGGKPAQEGEYPWQAAVYYFQNFICGGVLLSDEWVVTLASCVPSSDTDIYDIALGTNSLDDYSDNLQFRGIREIYIHPQYDFSSFDYDVALLRLSEPVTITNYVRMACLPTADMDKFFPPETVCTATGWGEEEQFGDNVPVLYEVDLPLLNNVECGNLYDPTPISDNMVCAGPLEGGNGVCTDDAGGPLVNEYNGQFYLVGIPSFSRGCAQPNAPAVYMRMTAFEEWISDVLVGNITNGIQCDETFTDAPGNFMSPFYPENYPNNATCRTRLTAPEGYRVYLDVTDFLIESDGPSCTNDFDTLSVYDADSADPMNLLGTFCGTVIDDYFISSGRNLYVVFKSDLSVTTKGFTAIFYFLPESGCDNDITDGPGMVMSPFFPDRYPNNLVCTTHLMATEGETVIVEFRDFDLEPDINNCQQRLDTLSIYDGDTASDEFLMGVFCGNQIPQRFQSMSRSMLLVFKTDSQAAYKGYEAAYYFIPPTQAPVTPTVTPPFSQPDCGMQMVALDPETNVVGGKDAQVGEYPWMVAVYVNNNFMCGGSLLSSRWVITSALCLDGVGGTVTVAAGTNQRDGGSAERTTAFRFVHPEFNRETRDFDVLLLKLADPLQGINNDDYIVPICVPSAAMDTRFDTGTMCVATGWGARFEGGPPVDDLQEVDLEIQSQSFCMQHYYPDVVTDNMLCAGPLEGGKGVCEGDEGGPLVANIGGRWWLVGMSSWDRGCAMEFFPTIYTRVTMFAEWIAPIFNGQDPDTSEPTPDPIKGIQDELEKVVDEGDIYMKVMFGLVAGIVLVLLILLYVVYSSKQKNERLAGKLYSMQGDGEGGIGVALPATSTNVYEMNVTEQEERGGVANEALDIDDEAKIDAKKGAAVVAVAAAAADAAETPEKKDMATDNPEFIKYDDEDEKL